MVLDECPKLTRDKKILSNAINTSTKWAKRCKIEFGNDKKKALFGITQGGLYKDLRIESLEKLKEIDFDGYAIGGMAVGETQSQMFKILENSFSLVASKNLPIHSNSFFQSFSKPMPITKGFKIIFFL